MAVMRVVAPGEITVAFNASSAGVVPGEQFAMPKATPHNGRALSWDVLPDLNPVTVTLLVSLDGSHFFTPTDPAYTMAVSAYTVSQIPNLIAAFIQIVQTVHGTAGNINCNIYT